MGIKTGGQMLYRYEASKGLAELKGKKMQLSKNKELFILINSLSADLTVHPLLIVEALQEHKNLQDSVKAWLAKGSLEYDDILAQFNEVF